MTWKSYFEKSSYPCPIPIAPSWVRKPGQDKHCLEGTRESLPGATCKTRTRWGVPSGTYHRLLHLSVSELFKSVRCFFLLYLLAYDTISVPLAACPTAHKLSEIHNTCCGVIPQARKGEGLLKQNKANNLGLQDLQLGECQSIELTIPLLWREKCSPPVSQEGTAARTESVCIHFPK